MGRKPQHKEGLGGRLSSHQRLYVARKERKDGGKGKKQGREKKKRALLMHESGDRVDQECGGCWELRGVVPG